MGIRNSAEYFGNSNEFSNSIKYGKFIGKPKDYTLLNK
jgi:hypothetical protein